MVCFSAVVVFIFLNIISSLKLGQMKFKFHQNVVSGRYFIKFKTLSGPQQSKLR